MTASFNGGKPILVTGAHRSGTTWVGKMLAADKQSIYIGEPLNAEHPIGLFEKRIPYWYTYICEENGADYLPAFKKMLDYDYGLLRQLRTIRTKGELRRTFVDQTAFRLAARQHRRAIIKDPFAIFSVAWFLEEFSCDTFIVVRHPAAFASSLKYLGWFFDFNHLLKQRLLMRDWLEPYRAEMQATKSDDIIGQASLLWVMINSAAHKIVHQYPQVSLLRHEDLSRDPLQEYQKIYDQVGLTFSPKAQNRIRAASNAQNPKELTRETSHLVALDSRANIKNWQHRLSIEEIERVRERTLDVASLFYDEADWD
ncbi:MAG: sulfotransferase [Anaerolineales bacterium]|nr:sulfotransferase [Anaerolineales bacterium]